MTLSIGANAQNTLYPTQNGLSGLNSSNLANANPSPIAANDFGPAVIISLSPQALNPETEAGGTVTVIGQRIEGITEADRQRLSQLSTLNGIISSDNRDNASYVRNLDLEGLMADFNNPDEVHLGEDGKVKQQFSTERALQAIAIIKRLRSIDYRGDGSLIEKAHEALNKINQSPLGKAIAAAQTQFGLDLDGLESMLQNQPPGQALEYTQENDPNAAGGTVLVTARRLSVVDPSLVNGLDIPFVNPPLPTVVLPEIEIPYTEKKFETEGEALNAGIAEINKHPDKNRKELGFFVYKDAAGKFQATALLVGQGRDLKINIPAGSIPSTAVGFLHSHPAHLLQGYGSGSERDVYQANFRLNRYPSNGYGTTGLGDMGAWAIFEARTNNPNFKMWILGPDGVVREFIDQSVLPPEYANGTSEGTGLPRPPVGTEIPGTDLLQ